MKPEATAFAVLSKDAFAGKQFERFEVLCKLGEGGMSEVFLAWQKSVGGFRRPVVLKRIRDSIRHDPVSLQMFVQEAKITSGLSHGNIAALHDLSHEERGLFMVMEFVPGATLFEIAKACAFAEEEIPLGLTVGVLRDTALALHYAHTFKDPAGRSRPVIHRDISDKNLMVSFDGTTKLLDFGIARQQGRKGVTLNGMVKGTAGYMSPEQIRGEAVDARTDVFSLGVVLHECLTGCRLFVRESRVDEIHALLTDPVPAPSQRNRRVPIELDAVVLKALARDKDQRFANARELAAALDRAVGGLIWEAEARAEFIQKHFADRQEQLGQLLGDPGRTDVGEATDSTTDPRPLALLARDQRSTLNLRKRTPHLIESSSATLAEETVIGEEAARDTQEEGDSGRALPASKSCAREPALSPQMLAMAAAAAIALATVLLLILSRH